MGNRRPATPRATRKEVWFSVKFVWARWAAKCQRRLSAKDELHTAVETVRLRVLGGELLAGTHDGVVQAAALPGVDVDEEVEGVDEEARGSGSDDIAASYRSVMGV